MQKVYSGESYANSIDIYLNRLKGDVWTVEATENNFAEIDLFKPYATTFPRRSRSVSSTTANCRPTCPRWWQGVSARALEVIPADKLVLSIDCGFGRQGFNARRLLQGHGHRAGSQFVLKELGLEPRYVPRPIRHCRLTFYRIANH